MAKAKKLPSGQWRTLVYSHTDENGKRKYESFTASTKKESEFLAAEFSFSTKKNHDIKSKSKLKLKDAMKQYIDIKRSILSPPTIKSYESIRCTAFTSIENMEISNIDKEVLQRWVGQFSSGRSPKTVRNVSSFVISVLKYHIDGFHIDIDIPKKVRNDTKVPTDEEVEKLIAYYQKNDSNMLIASYLAAFGTLRRSEICGLHSSDVSGRIIKIRNAMVQSAEREFVLKKRTKNYSSSRDVLLPQFVIDVLPTDGMIVTISPDIITQRHRATLKKLSLPLFRFHDLRHYSASILHALGIPDQYIMQRGGWSSDETLKRVYRGTIDTYEEKFNQTAMTHFEKMQHDLQHD